VVPPASGAAETAGALVPLLPVSLLAVSSLLQAVAVKAIKQAPAIAIRSFF
jgi:hypothetical protein